MSIEKDYDNDEYIVSCNYCQEVVEFPMEHGDGWQNMIDNIKI